MISHKETGYLAKYKSSEDLAEGIHWVLEHSDKQKLSENCIVKVKTEFSKEIVAAKYIEAYQSLL
jgi:glycosyltransferase involved in cell wall biosynthesis